MRDTKNLAGRLLKPFMCVSLAVMLAVPVAAVETVTPEHTYTMPMVWRNLYAKALQYVTESNLAELNEAYHVGKEVDADAISFTYLFGYELSEEASYIASPDGIYETYVADGLWDVESTQAIDLGKHGIYVTYGSDVCSYQYAGFPTMPDLYYSLATNGECYLNQRTLGYPYGCCPVSLSMAMKLSGEMDFDYTGFFAALKRQGYRFQSSGITLPTALNALDRYADLSASTVYQSYNPFEWMQDILEGHPVVICIDNGLDFADGNFVQPEPAYKTGYHAELITGFFLCDGRLGFELYDPDPIGETGQGVLIWESDLWALCKKQVKGHFFSAISFQLEADELAQEYELTLQEQGKLYLMYESLSSCKECKPMEEGRTFVDVTDIPIPVALVS